MKKMITLLAVAGLVLALAGEANALLISVDMLDRDTGRIATVYETVSTYHFVGDLKNGGQNGTDDQIGVWDNGAASANWWNYVMFNNWTCEATGLRDADKNVTGVSVSLVVPGDGHIGEWGATPNDDLLPDGGAWQGAAGLTTTISGLDAGSPYNVIVYHNQNHPSETVTINGQAASDYTGDLANPGYGDAFEAITDADFWYFENVAADGSGELVISSTGTGYQTIVGFQVSSPGPAGTAGTMIIIR
jgi:hypothetical protein